MSKILYGIDCTLFCALTYTCTPYRSKDPFLCALCSLCATLSIRRCLLLFPWMSPGRQYPPCWKICTMSSNAAGACGVAPLCMFLIGGVFPLVQCSDGTGSPGCCLCYCFYSLSKGFVLVRHSNTEEKAVLFRWQPGTQCRTCPVTGAAQLFLQSAKTAWILAKPRMCSCSCSLSQLISLFEGATGQICDNFFPG